MSKVSAKNLTRVGVTVLELLRAERLLQVSTAIAIAAGKTNQARVVSTIATTANFRL